MSFLQSDKTAWKKGNKTFPLFSVGYLVDLPDFYARLSRIESTARDILKFAWGRIAGLIPGSWYWLINNINTFEVSYNTAISIVIRRIVAVALYIDITSLIYSIPSHILS